MIVDAHRVEIAVAAIEQALSCRRERSRAEAVRGDQYHQSPQPPIVDREMIRQLFALLASRHQTPADIVQAVWSLNLINLQLAMHRLGEIDDDRHALYCDALDAMLLEPREPQRWAGLQHLLGQIANDTLVNTLQGCLIAYNARLRRPPPLSRERADEILALERSIVVAIRNRARAEAESIHRQVQARLEQSLLA